jgi:hypothetical protein
MFVLLDGPAGESRRNQILGRKPASKIRAPNVAGLDEVC